MQTVILAGGLATRMRPMTDSIPKSMIRVNDRPFLEHQLDLLRENDIRDIILCVGHLSNMIKDYFGDGRKFGVRITYSDEGKRLLGTGGALRKAESLLEIGQYYEAARRYQAAHRLNPLNPLPLIGKGNAFLAAGNYASATVALLQGFERYPELVKVREQHWN